MPHFGMRRFSLALAAATLAAAGGLAVGSQAQAASQAPAAASALSLLILPDQGENAIYNFVNSATTSIDVTIYELKDTTLENDLVSREKAGVTVRVILDQAQKSYNTAAYNTLTAGGVGVTYSSTAFTYTHQKTITVNNDESYISTGNFDNTYYATSRDYGVFDTNAADVAAIVAVFNADYAKTSITPSDGTDLVWSPTDSQTQLLALINGAQHTLDVEQEEFSSTALVNAVVADAKRGVTVNVGVVRGGTKPNVIAEEAYAEVDMRVPTIADADELVPKILNLTSRTDGVSVKVTGGLNRPPYEKGNAGAALFEHAKTLAGELGIDLVDTATGGGSDGNFTAPHTATLDGLGVDGQGAHTHYEQIYISSIEPRARLLHRLYQTLR